MSITLTTGGSSNKRRELDFYPTPPEVTRALMLFLALTPGVIWEPACGDGAMAGVIREHGHEVISSDIRQTGYGEGEVDFLTALPRTCDAIITNPPFAQAEAFIRKAVGIAPITAMLLKSQYWHAQKRQSLFSEHPPAFILPLTWRPDFMNGERGGAPTMECLWTVWMDGQTDTRYRLLPKPPQKQASLFAAA